MVMAVAASASRSAAAEKPLGALLPSASKRWRNLAGRPGGPGAGEEQPPSSRLGYRPYGRSQHERPINAPGSGRKADGLLGGRGRRVFALGARHRQAAPSGVQ
jgi:hypothetical protein